MTLTGTPVPRKEDPRLLRGQGAFTDPERLRSGGVHAVAVPAAVQPGHVRRDQLSFGHRQRGRAAQQRLVILQQRQ